MSFGNEEDIEHFYRHIINDHASQERAEEKMKRGMMKRSTSIDGSSSVRDPTAATPPSRLRMSSKDSADDYITPMPSLLESESQAEEEEHDVRELLFEAIPEPYCEYSDHQRVRIDEVNAPDLDATEASRRVKKCLQLRKKWMEHHPIPPQDLSNDFDGPHHPDPGTPIRKKQGDMNPHDFRRRMEPKYDVFARILPGKHLQPLRFVLVDGVFNVVKEIPPHPEPTSESAAESATTAEGQAEAAVAAAAAATVAAATAQVPDVNANLCPVLSFQEFLDDFSYVRESIYAGVVATFCFKRLELLNAHYNLHILLNGGREVEAAKSVPHRDFYNVRKVDTHVHHSACMNQKHLLRFIKHKLRYFPNDVVAKSRDGKPLRLCDVFQTLGLTAYDLSIDTLDMHCYDTFHRFDRFNLKYNPAGQSVLREIFLKTDNFIGGRYLAELTLEVMEDLKNAKYQLAEWRVSIYGKNINEWQKLAKWFFDNKLSSSNIRWLIQVPRLFQIYRANGEVASFADMLHNIFYPLFEASADPAKYPEIHYFLQAVVAFDSVDDESRPEHGRITDPAIPAPQDWTMTENPPFGYWMYYMYANILALNKFRASRGLSTFAFRPHCGEAGDIEHMISTFLLANQINHGIQLRKNTGLHYLYYLAQIGIAISPLSNNKLFLDFHKNPFIKYFRQGLNVSLSTDDPLMLHYTKDPLLEEYSVATQVWKLSSTDQCEIARNSVLQSGWEAKYKRHYLGTDYEDPRETNVCKIRLQYRKETMACELDTIERYATESYRQNPSPRAAAADLRPFSLPPASTTATVPTTSLSVLAGMLPPSTSQQSASAAAPVSASFVLQNLAHLHIGGPK